MQAFSALLALCEGNSSVIGELPTHRPVTRSVDALFDLLPDPTVEQTMETLEIFDPIALIMILL